MATAALILLVSCFICVLANAHGYRFVGCFLDSSDRDLPLYAEGGSMSPFRCNQICTGRRFAYFGVQAGKHCLCGNGFGKYGPKPMTECNHDCSGDRTHKCGGDWRNSVYTTDFNLGFGYIGCFADYVNGVRDLPQLAIRGSVSVQKCLQECKRRKFVYFGLQNSDECWCGNTFGRFGFKLYVECNNKCSGDPSELCGNVSRNSIYAITN